MKTTLLTLFFWHCAMFSFSANQSAQVRIVFPFNPTNVVLHLWGSYMQDFTMTKSGTNEFSFTVPDINQYMLFNISYDLPDYNIMNWWVGSGNVYQNEMIPNRFDAHGLKFGLIYINNQLINNAYTAENGYNTGLNIAVKINDDQTIEPYKMTNNKYVFVDDRIPAEVHHHYSYLNTHLPLANHVRITGWLQALTDYNIIGDSKIEVDYIRVYGRRGLDSVLLASHEYNNYDATNDGGLYLRYPFFPAGFDQHMPMPGTVKDGILTFYPSDVSKKVWHFWSKWNELPNTFNYESYKMVARIRINGHAVVQGGIDFRDAAEKTYELGVTDWYFENCGAWQEVVFDTKTFITNDNPVITKNTPTELHLSIHNDNIILNYKGLTPGNYTINLFDVQGKKLMSKILNLENYSGTANIKDPSNQQEQIILYELSNSSRIVFSGKNIIR